MTTFEADRAWSRLENDEIDLVLTSEGLRPNGADSRKLYDERFALIRRRGHPSGPGPIDLDAFCALEHILVSPVGGGFSGATDVALTALGRARRVSVSVPSFLLAPALVATSDGVFTEDEVHAIESEVTRDPDLNATERTRLLAYLAFLSKNPPSTRILTRFKDQPPEKRQALAQLAVAVAAADGRLAPEEVKLLEKIYRTLGLPEGSLYSDLQSFAASDETLLSHRSPSECLQAANPEYRPEYRGKSPDAPAPIR